MTNQNLTQIIDSAVGYLLALSFLKLIAEPTVIYLGRKILKKADAKFKWIPDFLTKDSNG